MKRCYAFGPDCDGPMQLHHICKAQRIRKEWRSLMAAMRFGGPRPWSITKALADNRNRIATCQRHHKEDIPMPLPPGFWTFVEEYGLQGCLPRYLAEEEAA
jgi:hypothetical protein